MEREEPHFDGQPIAQRLARFADWIITASWTDTDVCGADIQDWAQSLGLITSAIYDPEVHGRNDVGAQAGDAWFVASPAFLRALASPAVGEPS